MPKHTPGPWRVNWNPPHRPEIETVDQPPGKYRHMTNACPVLASSDDEIEVVKDERTGRECKLSAEACANMRLMATAPELLTALKAALPALLALSNSGTAPEDLCDEDGYLIAARLTQVAIAKAEGKPVFYCQSCKREESICSADPCAGVLADREATA